MSKNTQLNKSAFSRLIKDIRDVIKNPLHDSGIYYKHHESDMLSGYAMIVGPEKTPYYGGFYFFEFKYPPEYPYSPPQVTFSTNWNNIRFNPNLYANGKVCLSILNTWFGESWSSCDTLRTILLQLCLLFTPSPLLNEPGVTIFHVECAWYAQAVEYHNIDVAICNTLLKTPGFYLPFFDLFYDVIRDIFLKNREHITEFVKSKTTAPIIIRIPIYEMVSVIDYNTLLIKIENINII
jgi:ubiquitin-conjugating enzyme E2 Z